MADNESEWTVLETVSTVEEAELITGFLRNEEIPCRVDSHHSNEFPLTVGELGEIHVEVPDDRLEEARRRLGELQAGADEEADLE
jgi:hypothetical protein